MLGWFSTVGHTLSWSVGYLDRTLRTRNSATAYRSDSTPEQGHADAQCPGSGSANDDTLPEWQAGRESQTSGLRVADGSQWHTVPEWKTDVWKHRVEGEARKRLKGEIAGVS